MNTASKLLADQKGREAGIQYQGIWNSQEKIVQDLALMGAATATHIAKSESQKFTRWHWGNGIAFTVFIILTSMTPVNKTFGILGVAVFLGWLLSILRMGYVAIKRSEDSARLRREAMQRYIHSAYQVIALNQRKARNHIPSGNGATRGAMPAPQPHGVSHKGAEELCCLWMKYLGELDARTTKYVADGGIDVESLNYIAQVKNYVGTVGVAAIRELAGVATTSGRKALFFTSGSYASGAVDFANQSQIALFIYDAERGTLRGTNSLAEKLLNSGL